MKTAELTGEALDRAVAQAMGRKDTDFGWWWDNFKPSTDWAQGGPIIERKKIELVPSVDGKVWYAESLDRKARVERCPTPLIAAMRCYVASKLGDEVDLPEELA